MAGRIKCGSLIKFITDYPAPSKKVEYRKHPTIPNQLQVRENKEDNFVNIQDSNIEYNIPFFFGDKAFEKDHIFDVEDKDFIYEITSLPKQNEDTIDKQNIAGSEQIQNDDGDFDFDSFDFEDIDYENDIDTTEDSILKSNTDLIDVTTNTNTTKLITPSEIYAPAVANGSTDNPYGIQIVNNMRSYIDTFPAQYRDNIKQLLANDELNYTC